MPHDRVDVILAQWARERPDLDASPMEVPGRILRAARYIDGALDHVFKEFGLDFGLFDVLKLPCVVTVLRISCPLVSSTAGACCRPVR